MTTSQDCIDAINNAAGRKLGDDELDSLLSSLQARQRFIQAQGHVAGSRQAALQAAEEVANNVRMAAVIEKRNASINLTKRIEQVAWIQRNFGHNVAEGLEALLVGVNRAKQGAREGVSQVQAALKSQYLAGFVTDLERTTHMSLFASGAMDRDIARALWAIGRENETALHSQMPKPAVEIAKVVNKWQEAARLDANDAGAWVGKVTGYITKQAHNAEKIRGDGSAAAFEAWKQVALDKFDIPRMLMRHGAVNVDAMLRGEWNDLASGNFMRAAPDDALQGFVGPANLAKKLSQSREILFKDADAWHDYNAQYGSRNLREAVVKGLSHSAEATGLMRQLGTNPKAMFDTIRADLNDSLKTSGDVGQVSKLSDKEGRLANFMAAVDGTMNMPGNAMWARRAANVRAWEMLSKLGGMLLSQANDVAVYGSGARYQGRGFLTGMAESVAGLGRNLKDRDKRELAASLGVVLDNMAGELGRIGSFSEAGSMSKATMLFMKLNGGDWWVVRMRASAALGMAHHMALQSERGWSRIGAEYQRVLGLYNIDAAKWDVIRQSSAKHVDGKGYIVPEGVRNLSDEAMSAYVKTTGQAVNADTIDTARREIEGNLRTYYSDQTTTLALDPDAKVRATMLQGTRPGTVPGEFFRFLAQFKSFTGAYMQRVMGRELFGRGYEGDSIWGALRHGNGEFTGLAQLIATSTLMGYASMQLKALAAGKTAQDPLESPAQAAKVMLAAMVQGGGAGIYFDFLFGQASRMGSGTIESLAGPTISTGGRVFDLYHKALAGDHFAANAAGEALNNTPFLNLFYTRAALNYLVLYRMQETMNPGYLRRMESNVEKAGQRFIMRPSEVVH